MHIVGNEGKMTPTKMTEQKVHRQKMIEKSHTRNNRKYTPGKGKTWKMYNRENENKCTSQKMIENLRMLRSMMHTLWLCPI